MGNWAVIMAGGAGKRFWPQSLQKKPKQFLTLNSDKTLIEECLERLLLIYEASKIFIAASVEHIDCINEILPNFPHSQIIWEPIGRNTAPCLAWATETIRRKDENAIIGVFPSDHAIADPNAFAAIVKRAQILAINRIILFGIQPTRPETGYGYIKAAKCCGDDFFEVERFAEKPNAETALLYLNSGHYLWNSGIFIFDAKAMIEELDRFEPKLMQAIREICDKPEKTNDIFPNIKSISIDYAVMEKTDKAYLLRANFPWNDIGSWAAVQDLYEKDKSGNVIIGDTIIQDCENLFIFSSKDKIITCLGIKDLIVVNTEKAMLVTTASEAQNVRKIVEILEKQGRTDLL